MDARLQQAYDRLQKIRKRTDLKLKATDLLKDTFTDFDGTEKELKIRYYQVQGILHMVSMNRFLLGDDTGIGKCVSGSTLILTDGGLVPIRELWAEGSCGLDHHPKPGTFVPATDHKVWTGERWAKIKSFYYDGDRLSKFVQTRYGFSVEGSHRHPILIRSETGEEWRRLPEVQSGDYVVIERRQVRWPQESPDLTWEPSRASNAKTYSLPTTLTPRYARLLGYFVAEGNSSNPHGFTITQHEAEIHKDIRACLLDVFGWSGNENSVNRDEEIVVSSAVLRDFLEFSGAKHTTSEAKCIPWSVLQGPQECAQEFLRGLFEGDGHALATGGIEYTSKSLDLVRGVQTLLLRFGVVAQVSEKPVNGETYWRMNILGDDARVFRDEIGFISCRKTVDLQVHLDKPSNTNHDIIPHVAHLVEPVYEALKEATHVGGPNGTRQGSGIKQFGDSFRNSMQHLLAGRRDLTYSKLRELLSHAADFNLDAMPEFVELHRISREHHFYDPVSYLDDSVCPLMDLEIDAEEHSFVGNGLINHNTIQSIAALCYVWAKERDTKVIVLTNKSVVAQWAIEFDKFCKPGEINVITCVGSPAARKGIYQDFEASSGPTVLIMGYATARRDIKLLQDYKDFIFITDEATAYKNPSTQTYQVVRHMANQAKRVWALTATLIKNNLIEGYGIYSVVVPGLFPKSKNGFMNMYCITRLQPIAGSRRSVPVIVGYRKDQIARFKEKIDPYFLSRAKHDVASELPVLTIKTDKVGMTREQQAKYKEALDGLLEIDQTNEEKETTKLTALIYCQQIVDHPDLIDCEGDSEKMDRLFEMLTEGDLADEKVVVFTRFRKMVDLLEKTAASKKYRMKTVRITGAESEVQRQEAMKKFQDPDSDVRVIWINEAAKEGVNLQAAKALIFYDSPWSAGDYIQVLGRIIRIGSTHDRCYAIHLVAKGTIDDKVMAVLKKKMKLIEAIMGKRLKSDTDSDDVVTTENDISDIFSAMQSDARSR